MGLGSGKSAQLEPKVGLSSGKSAQLVLKPLWHLTNWYNWQNRRTKFLSIVKAWTSTNWQEWKWNKIYLNVSKSWKYPSFHLVDLEFKSVMCFEVTLTILCHRTKRTCIGYVQDKTDSNRRRTIDVSPVRSVTGFVHVIKFLTDLPKISGYRMDTTNAKLIENWH